MDILKRIGTILLILIISMLALFYSYNAINEGAVVYATNQDGTLTNDELDVALSSWLQSHGGNIFSPSNYRARKTYEAGLLHNFIYGDGGGYDAIRQHINGGVGGNNELRFDYDGFIIQKLNTWLNKKLQNGEFGNDVSLDNNGMLNDNVNNLLYSGSLFVTDSGQSCLMYVINGNYSSMGRSNKNNIIAYGTFLDTGEEIEINSYKNYSYTVHGNTYTGNKRYVTDTCNGLGLGRFTHYEDPNIHYTSAYDLYYGWNYNWGQYGGITAIKFNDAIALGTIGMNIGWSSSNSYDPNMYNIVCTALNDTQNNVTDNVNITFVTNNNLNITNYPDVSVDGKLYITPKVKVNGEYKNYTVNEGDTINNVINNYYQDSNDKDKTVSYPSTNPDDNGGGNGGDDNPSGGGGNDNPSGGGGGNIPEGWGNPIGNLSPDGSDGLNVNFKLPNLNIDWSIDGLTEKFPFSIPFDFISFCRVLNADPVTPEIEGQIDLGLVNWDIDWDLHQFDDVASLFRNLEFIGFCIALILITRQLIKG